MKLIQYTLTLFLLILASALAAQSNLTLTLYELGFVRVVDISNAGDERLFICEQGGLIKIIDGDGNTLPAPFLDIRSRVNDSQNEQGLLGLAFDPNYAQNGYFYINYTGGSGDGQSRISRFSRSANDPNAADANSEEMLLTLDQPAWNHNGGDLAFGPDGYLYIGFGDGGSGGDPWGNSQNKAVWFGKMLRIDVSGNTYTVPLDNPFVSDPQAAEEIWAYGLRNPWRFSFDRETGDMWIGDVGQNAREEIDFQPASSLGGENYGWNCREGDLAFGSPSSECDPIHDTYVEPVVSYLAGGFCNSVTGGYVYRGCKYPDLYGKYVYADYCHGLFWTIEPDGQGGWINTEVFDNSTYDISTFGEDMHGELYAARLDGQIYQVGMGAEQTAPNITINDNELSVPSGLSAYQWYLNGNAIPNATGNTFIAGQSGEYSVEVTYSNGCTFLSSAVMLTVGLGEVSWLDLLSVTPNPFSERVAVNIQLPVSKALVVSVLDVQGKEMYRRELAASLQVNEQLKLGSLPSGVYMLRIRSDEGSWSMKLVKE